MHTYTNTYMCVLALFQYSKFTFFYVGQFQACNSFHRSDNHTCGLHCKWLPRLQEYIGPCNLTSQSLQLLHSGCFSIFYQANRGVQFSWVYRHYCVQGSLTPLRARFCLHGYRRSEKCRFYQSQCGGFGQALFFAEGEGRKEKNVGTWARPAKHIGIFRRPSN